MIRRVRNLLQVGNRPGGTLPRAVLLSWLLLTFPGGWGCAPVGQGRGDAGPAEPPYPAIRDVEMSRSQAREGSELLREARDSLAAGAAEAALGRAERVIRDYPGAEGSAEALGIAAAALMTLQRPGEAGARAGRLALLLPETDPRRPGATLLSARALLEAGEEEGVLTSLRAMPRGAPEGAVEEGRELLRQAVPALPARSIQEAAEGYPETNPLRGTVAAEWASALYLRGEVPAAEAWARVALEGPLGEREGALARGVLEGRLEEVLGRPIILGTVLPRSGASPGLLQYGGWVEEGIQVALEEYRDQLPRPVELEGVDDRGSPLGGRTAVRTLRDYGAMGAIGFLTQDVLEEAAASRGGAFPLLSPFAYVPPDEAPDVFSLSGPDPGGARLVAQVAWDLGLETVAVVRPDTREARVNSTAFQEEYQALGGFVPREIVFDSGATFFQPQFQEVEAVLPDGLFLPLAPRDIQLLAPQVTFYGLDTLGIQLLGTSGWTEESVVQDVDSRHTDGVVAATVRLTQDETEAFQRFREAYEALFQKSLRSQVPAFGYDAAKLILEALRSGPRNPEELVAALEEIEDLEGATGNLSVDRGWVIREPLLVRIQDQELIYITRRFR